MPGIGKTTLTRKVYNNLNVVCYFHRHAWWTVSQTYSKRESLVELLSHIAVLPDDISRLSDDDLMAKLRRYLLGNKYLIVMDNLWDTEDVVLEIKPDSNPHRIRPFSDVESWKLLQHKIFKGADCPDELLAVGMEIAHLCQGLPLAVVAIAGPPKDKDILVSKLIRLWMAEGFIQETESKSSEEVAEDYLMELINRSLVNISQTKSNGMDKPYAFFPDPEYDMELENLLAPIIYESYRLSFYVKRPHFINYRPSGPTARSLMFFASSDSEPKCPYDISFICHNFKLLRVLDLESIMAISFPLEIGLMVQLRYLAVSDYMQSLPPSISNLWKLETLVVKGSRGKVILPDTIWSMRTLRHLHVNNHVLFNLQNLNDGAGNLINLVSFSTPALSCSSTLKRFSPPTKLHVGGFEMQRWHLQEEEFKELKFLELDTMNLAEWDASCDELLLSLERLILCNCKDSI
ncbi:OLC1v1019170C1 [Oldenlandia corymbosa var. corymbosa]|uniref:OLC1v1019170C1 n=1 Tax=Oldenlandia corymbosa var. corymbosa TaxID=529605 RepID=A0AAV1EDE9_OLDCO|nr:OLC1v1019170C1 [Oldenlandia corymbosa var. corymbosa]